METNKKWLRYIYSWSLRLSEVKNPSEKLFRGSNKSLEDYVDAKPRNGVIGFKTKFVFVMLLAVETGKVNIHCKSRLKNRQTMQAG